MGGSLKESQVSTIIPTYNSEETLGECLESIMRQTYPSCEVIVVDGYSKDRTLEIARKYGAKTLREKCGPAAARNIGIAHSKGKYVFFLDSDQTLSPPVIQDCVGRCERSGVGMVRIPEIFVGKSFWSCCSAAWKNCYQRVELREAGRNTLVGEPRFFVKDYIIRVGMFNDSLLWGEDYDLYVRMRKTGVKEASCEFELYHNEPTSLREILHKIYRYGGSLPIFTQRTGRKVFRTMFTHSLLTFEEVLREYGQFPKTVAGCTVLLCLKSYSIVLGLMTGLMFY